MTEKNKANKATSLGNISDSNGGESCASKTVVTSYIIQPSQSIYPKAENSEGSISLKVKKINIKQQQMYVLDPDVAELLAEGSSMRDVCRKLTKVNADSNQKINSVYDHSGVIDSKASVQMAAMRAALMTIGSDSSCDRTTCGKNTPDKTSQKSNHNAKKRKAAKNIITSMGVMEPSSLLNQKEWLEDNTYTCKECQRIFSKDANYLYLIHLLGHLHFLVFKEELEDNNRHLLQRIIKDENIVSYLNLHGLEMDLYREFIEDGNIAAVSNCIEKESKQINWTSTVVGKSTNIENDISTNIKTENDSVCMQNKLYNDSESDELDSSTTCMPSYSETERQDLHGHSNTAAESLVSKNLSLFENLTPKKEHIEKETDISNAQEESESSAFPLESGKKVLSGRAKEKDSFKECKIKKLRYNVAASSSSSLSLVNPTPAADRPNISVDLDMLDMELGNQKVKKKDIPEFEVKYFGKKSCSTVSEASEAEAFHFLKYQLEDDKPFQCIICNINFRLLETFVMHMSQVHKKYITASQVRSMELDLSALSDKPTNYMKGIEDGNIKCTESECFQTFKGVNSLHQHKKDVHGINRPWQCTQCEQNFKRSEALTRHIELAHSEEKTDCDICEKNFTTRKALRAHIGVVHPKHKSPRCSQCKKEFISNVLLNAHIKYKHASSVKCDVCQKRCATKHHLKKHQLVHAERKKLICIHCKKKFIFEENLKKHIEAHHSEPLLDKPFSCSHCEKKLRDKPALDMHVTDMHNQSKDEDGLLSCPHCDKKFKTKYSRNKHVRGLHVVKLCPTCGKVCNSTKSLYYHTRKEHNEGRCVNADYERSVEEGKYKCEFCLRCFGRGDFLRIHERRHVCKDGSFQCLACPFDSVQKEQLVAHVMSKHSDISNKVKNISYNQIRRSKKNNSGLTSCQCDHCGMILSSKQYLKKHMQCYHLDKCTSSKTSNETREELSGPVLCKDCGKTYPNMVRLKFHIYHKHTVKNFCVCEVCGKKFTCKIILKKHMLVHAEPQYHCEICNKKFRRKYYFTVHQKMHNSVKQFVCPICFKQCSFSTGLSYHMKTHNK